MTAMEVYREDRQNRKDPQKRRTRQEYFVLLRDTLHEELMRDGRSDFLEEMLAECSGGTALRMLEFAALRECCDMIVENRPMQDASEYVPHIRSAADARMAWRELEAGVSYRVDDPGFPQMLRRLKSVSSQLVAVRDATLAPKADQALKREMDAVMVINHALEEQNAALRQERDALENRIRELEAGVINRQLQHQLTLRRQQAEADLQLEMDQRRQQAEENLQAAMDQAAARMQEDALLHQRETAARAQEQAGVYAGMQEEIRRAMQEMQDHLDQQMQGWSRQLHGADHRFLAQCAATLSMVAEKKLPRLMAGATLHGADETLLSELAELHASLNGQLAQMEQALAQLGLRMIRPAPGDAFDEKLHSPAAARAEDMQESAVVVRRETPGVVLAGSDGQPVRTLVRAVVHIRQAGEPA